MKVLTARELSTKSAVFKYRWASKLAARTKDARELSALKRMWKDNHDRQIAKA